VIWSRRITDLLVKGWQIVFPSVVHGDSSSSVIGIRTTIGIETSIFDSSPYVVNSSPRQVVFNPSDSCGAKFRKFLYASFTESFFVEASTRHGVALSQVSGRNPDFVPTIASTEPMGSISAFYLIGDGQSSESITIKI
jgi:hypothetical protein